MLRSRSFALPSVLVLLLSACDGGGGDSGDSAGSTGDSMGSTGGSSTGASGGSTTGDCGVDISHAADVQPIWDANCVRTGCHIGPTGAYNLVLEDAYDKIVDVPSNQVMGMKLVAPSDVAGSYLWHKINGTQGDVGGGGAPMPADDAMERPLSEIDPDAVATIRTWIECGAPP